MQPVQLVLGVHLHQPVGNFDHVLEESYQRAYRPFLDTFGRFPSLRMVWHCSGFLFQWLAARHPDYLDQLAGLVAAGRVEPLSGGMYEPIFPVIPPVDRAEQIRRLSELVAGRFGRAPQGVWLAERVWESGMVQDLAAAGIRYVSLDDYHFYAAGLTPEELDGYFTVEELDRAVGVFPISETMRYLIPWAELPRVEEAFRLMQDGGQRLTVMMDDAEKFGSWPGTYDWVYGRQWLEHFFGWLEAHPELVSTTTFADFCRDHAPRGRAALPGASYTEMGQWALPAGRALQYETLTRRLEQDGLAAEAKPFVRGGIWRNFLVKYPESNYLHKRILHLSRRFDTDAKRTLSAYDHLLQAQCNDVFWHGVFGGLYLPHLRHAAYRHLLEAQRGLERHEQPDPDRPPEIVRADLDLDFSDEILVNHRDYFCVLAPSHGGAVPELSFKPVGVNLLNVLARWREKYHLAAPAGKVVRLAGEPAGDTGAPGDLSFDDHPRHSLRETFYPELPDPEALRTGRTDGAVPFWDGAFAAEVRDDGQVDLRLAHERFPYRKTLAAPADAPRLEFDYEWSPADPRPGWLGVEWNLGIAGGDDPEKCCYSSADRAAARGLGGPGRWDAVDGWSLENRREGYAVHFRCSEPVTVCCWPVETVSLAIDAMEKTYQGLSVCFLFRLTGRQQRWRLTVELQTL